MKIARFWLLAALAALVAVPGGASSKARFSVIPFGTPDWSPDGRSLVFEGGRSADPVLSKRSDVYVLSVGGGTPRRLTRMPRGMYVDLPIWQPQGHLIAFGLRAGNQGPGRGIGLVDDRGLHRVAVITNGPSRYAWSPTGGELAFEDSHGGLSTIRAGSTKPRRVIESVSDFSRFSWSPDGSRIAFTFHGGGIGAVSLRSGVIKRLTKKGKNPVWASRGKLIAYSGESDGYYVIGSDGRNGARVSDTANLTPPVWAPDGRRLAYVAGFTGPLYVADIVAGRTQLVARPGVFTAYWSPKGDALAYNALEHLPSSEIYLVRPDGTHRRDLGLGALPVWSPDGSRLAYLYDETFSFSDLCVIKVTGGRRTCPVSRPATVVYADAVLPPNRLRIASISLVPARLGSDKDTVSAKVCVRDKRGRPVTNAIVSAPVTPAWMAAAPHESDSDCIAPLVLVPNSSLQLHGRLRIDVTARRPRDGARSPATAHRTAWLALGGSR